TPLSLLFRGGLLAAVPFFALGAWLLHRSWRREDVLGTFITAFIFSWAILEDLDGGHLLLLGVLLNRAGGSVAPQVLGLGGAKGAFDPGPQAPIAAGPRQTL